MLAKLLKDILKDVPDDYNISLFDHDDEVFMYKIKTDDKDQLTFIDIGREINSTRRMLELLDAFISKYKVPDDTIICVSYIDGDVLPINALECEFSDDLTIYIDVDPAYGFNIDAPDEDWQEEMEKHEPQFPLKLSDLMFFINKGIERFGEYVSINSYDYRLIDKIQYDPQHKRLIISTN